MMLLIDLTNHPMVFLVQRSGNISRHLVINIGTPETLRLTR